MEDSGGGAFGSGKCEGGGEESLGSDVVLCVERRFSELCGVEVSCGVLEET